MYRAPTGFKLNKPTLFLGLLSVLALILAACAPAAAPTTAATSAPAPSDTPAATATTAPEPTSTTASLPTTGGTNASGEATINVATDPNLGKILVDGKGMTLYVFDKDTTPDQSTCAGKCAQSWPPVLTKGNPTLGQGVDASMIGNAKLADGTMIVTYNHKPLYNYFKDTKAGDTNGQGVGEVWWVIGPDGNKIENGSTGSNSNSNGNANTNANANTNTNSNANTNTNSNSNYNYGSNGSSSPEAIINLATDAKLGQILVDGNGMTLYMYTKDGPDQSNCTGKCLQSWPALLTQGKPTLGAGVDPKLVGSAKLADGTMIVTYNHMPLYTFTKDKNAGDVTGQGSFNVWYVVSPDGKAVGYNKGGY